MLADMSQSETSDEALFEDFRKGSESAFESLVQRYERPLVYFLTRTTNNHALSEDVFQETFIKVFEKRELYDSGRPFKAWLYRIAINTAYDRLRQRHRSAAFSLDENFDLEDTSAVEPSLQLSRRELAESIDAAVAQLPESQRQVFVMREYEDLSYAEISEILDRPVNTLKSDMRRGLQKLQTLLDSLREHFETS